jgi:RNA 3'-terminal phosphate cyclase (ATP)
MILIDGAIGAGGGQVLRSCLTLSVVTGQSFTIKNIRARRKNPGLRAQHLSAVQLVGVISNASVKGAELGSTNLSFSPLANQPGKYQREIGTAGSTSLVLQTVYLPLSLLDHPSTITISGGTHVPMAPSFDFVNQHWLYYIKKMGFDISLEIIRAGFYPKGGGRIQGSIHPINLIKPLNLQQRGSLKQIWGVSAVANLERGIAKRQRERVLRRLGGKFPLNDIRIMHFPSKSKGTTLYLICEFEHSQCCYFSLGAKGKPAEQVADEVCEKIEDFLSTDATIDEYLADQLLLPLSFASGNSTFSTARITDHLVTNAEVIRKFLPANITISGKTGTPGNIIITPPSK